jgi:hypothetical protein
MELSSPYLWKKGEASKPMVDDLGITHHGRTETVNRALTDFGIEDSFGQASRRFREHYGFGLSESTADRVTKASGLQAEVYLEQKLLEGKDRQGQAAESDVLASQHWLSWTVARFEQASLCPLRTVRKMKSQQGKRSSNGVM